ncbi:helix-turn-helix transcriptional regulator [Amycolatopsis sp. QT-25]|uniref:helix-turn-helix domain-containing protein n=1 Tax=Amycolatopsis sp. QT-25 TaxID=3034022 RepID=UPI0023EDFA70|nr:helix-turn-helix transcriptional regulator [Amycolatopsis sp. QT-25]WET82966.1 helix-turn-helix transcriptional regulator [Amycolatopsis sp. QT-25]
MVDLFTSGSLVVTRHDWNSAAVYKGLQTWWMGMAELGQRLRAAREAADLSLSAMAAKTNYTKPYLSLLENGKRTVRPEHVTAYSRALNVSAEALYGPKQDPLRMAHEWLVAATPVAVHRTSGRRVGESLTSEIERRVIDLRYLDDTIGGGDLMPIVHRELADTMEIVEIGSYTENIGKRLLVALGELSQLVGWVASDAGHYQEAQRVYLDGVSAARDAGDQTLAGQLLSSLAYQMTNVGNPVDAALLAKTAVKGAERATPVAKALLLERVAWAAAKSRDTEAARRALNAVDDAYEARSAGIKEPEWVYWLNRDEIDVMAGRCYIEIGQPAEAAPLLIKAINGYEASHVREIALYQTWLAESYARAGELDAARDVIEDARITSTGINSTRLTCRVEEIEQLIN